MIAAAIFWYFMSCCVDFLIRSCVQSFALVFNNLKQL